MSNKTEAERLAELSRWKSTHAPRIEALEGLLRAAQLEAHEGREARESLVSERAANAILTSEVERLTAEVAADRGSSVLLRLVCDLRFALGDRGQRMQPELIEYAKETRKDAVRYQWLRDKSVPPHNFYISVPVEFDGVRYQPHEVDAYIDAAIRADGAAKG